MKIAILLTDISGIGGIERVTSGLSKEFSDRGHNVTVISCFRRFEQLTYPLDTRTDLKFLIDEDYNLKNSTFMRVGHVVKARFALKRFLADNEFDVIMCQAFLPAFLLSSVRTSARRIVCEHFKYELYNAPVTKIRNRIYSRFDQVVTLTDIDRDKYRECGIDAVTIPNAMPFPITSNGFKGKRIISVGRLQPQKGYDMLIPAMKPVAESYPDWHLDIFGEGPDRQQLQEAIDRFGLNDNVRLRGFTKDIRNELQNSSLAVVSSRFEGFPMTILEILANGVPCVSFDCPQGPGQLLRDGGGVLVPPENIEALSASIIRMIESEELRKACVEQGYRNVSVYTPQAIGDKWEDLFAGLGVS